MRSPSRRLVSPERVTVLAGGLASRSIRMFLVVGALAASLIVTALAFLAQAI